MTEKKQKTTRSAILAVIEKYLLTHAMEAEAFGWAAAKDSKLVSRLRKGGDITTRKLDDILRFTMNPPPKKKEKDNGTEKA